MLPTNFSEAIESGFLPYLLEANGHDNLVNTRTAKVNAVIKDLKDIKYKVENVNNYIELILNKHGLTEDMLTDAECNKISREVNRY